MTPIYGSSAHLVAFGLFAAAAAGTPGPSNALLTAVGVRAGFRRGLPSLLGQVAGMSTMLFAVTLGLGSLLLAHPLSLQVLKWAGAVLLCWMAFRIAAERPGGGAVGEPGGGAAGEPGGARPGGAVGGPGGFLGMAGFQWVNPKGWLTAAAAIAAFVDRHSGGAVTQAAVYAILFALVAVPCCLPWLAFGSVLPRLVRTQRAWRILHVTMAALLVGATVLLVLR